MNKQALTFLSLFSLILVLAVYYVMLPLNDKTNLVNNGNTDIEEVTNTNDLSLLQSKLELQRETVISENNAIVASASSTTDEKSIALETIQKTKQLINIEKEVVTELTNGGYNDVFVEISEKVIKVTVKKSGYTSKDANEVLRIVVSKVGTIYTPEVKFIEE